jgi:5-methylcytosine-specific restriction endonuclease McrA
VFFIEGRLIAMTDRKPIPAAVRAAVLQRANHCCEECGACPVELHHLTYDYWPGGVVRPDKGPLPIFGLETPDDLIALCRDCHEDKHIGPDGQFYVDPEECEDEWAYFDHMTNGAA